MKATHLRGDFFGGITAGVVALPLALAFGLQSGMGAIAGIYGAIGIGIVAALFGGTPTQISGPTGPMTVVTAAVVLTAVQTYGGLEMAMGNIICIFLLAGFLQIILGLLRVGSCVNYIPYPVVSGFMSGIGVIIIILQLFPFLGHTSPKQTIEVLQLIPDIISAINWTAVVLALATIAIIYIFPLISKLVPSPLLALITLTIVASVADLPVAIIGDIPEGLPNLTLNTLSNIDLANPSLIIFPALTLAALGAIDSLLTSVVADNMTKTRHNSNRELLGQGLGNMVAASIGGIPGAGATMRTVVNINSGGKTRLSGVIHGVALLLVLLGAGAYARLIPLPVLAGILITVGIGIIDYKGIRHILRVPRVDAAIMLVVVTMTVFVDLLQAVAVGAVLSCVLFMKKMSDIGEQNTASTDLSPDAAATKQAHIIQLNSPIFFGTARHFQQLLSAATNQKTLIIRMESVPYIDQSGAYALEEAISSLQQAGVVVMLAGAMQQPQEVLGKIGVIPNLITPQHCYATLADCTADIAKNTPPNH